MDQVNPRRFFVTLSVAEDELTQDLDSVVWTMRKLIQDKEGVWFEYEHSDAKEDDRE